MSKTSTQLALSLMLVFSTINGSEFQKPDYIEAGLWNSVSPYFIPQNHPMKSRLDEIFQTRVTLNPSTMKKAGFKSPEPRAFSKAVVSKHPKLKGYLIKAYLDETPGIADADRWLLRIKGAEIAQKLILKYQYQNYFKVPKKLIYPLPENPAPPSGLLRKNFILLVEDLKPVKNKENKENYRNNMSSKLLRRIHKLIQKGGLDDSIVIANLPFCKDGRLAFLDTEIFNRWPIRFHILDKRLSNRMSVKLHKLIKKTERAVNP